MADFCGSSHAAHCGVAECKQLDFLPYECDCCHVKFCGNHRHYDSHGCNKMAENVLDSRPDKHKHHPCAFKGGCEGGHAFPITCPMCNQNFCLSHRLEKDHECVSLIKSDKQPSSSKVTKTASATATASSQSGPKKALDPKKLATFEKVRLMKLKMKATGAKNCVGEHRFFLDVFLPSESKMGRAPMFFTRGTSVGRALDDIAKHAGMKNENNVAPPEKRIALYKRDGSLLPNGSTFESMEKAGSMSIGEPIVIHRGESLPESEKERMEQTMYTYK